MYALLPCHLYCILYYSVLYSYSSTCVNSTSPVNRCNVVVNAFVYSSNVPDAVISRTFASFKPPVWCVKVKGSKNLDISVVTEKTHETHETYIHLIQQHIDTKKNTTTNHKQKARTTTNPQQLLTRCLLAY